MLRWMVMVGLLLPAAAQADRSSYWHSGKAELSRYSLQQARYGELHEGHAVLVYVTEPMHPQKQVKADRPGPDAVPVLKLNFTRKFNTGLYPYSVMTSTFAPETGDDTPLKITTSVQEWCGHVFIQLNRKGEQFAVESRSYFESEGDRTQSVPAVFPEEGIWTRIRIAPDRLPTGAFKMLPGTVYTRLLHRPLSPVDASATLSPSREKGEGGAPLSAYSVSVPSQGRTLEILFETEFPHRIERFTDTYPPLFGSKTPLVTKGQRTHTIVEPYWQMNGNRHRGQRRRLGLEP